MSRYRIGQETERIYEEGSSAVAFASGMRRHVPRAMETGYLSEPKFTLPPEIVEAARRERARKERIRMQNMHS